jgi:excinuclease ABC subunit B
VQTIGRTARNVNGRVILYAERETAAMRETVEEVERRRGRQLAYNEAHGIEPETIRKAIRAGIAEILRAREVEDGAAFATKDVAEREERLRLLEAEMFRLADELRFEEAAKVRDRIAALRSAGSGARSPAAAVAAASRRKKEAKARRKRAGRKWKR